MHLDALGLKVLNLRGWGMGEAFAQYGVETSVLTV